MDKFDNYTLDDIRAHNKSVVVAAQAAYPDLDAPLDDTSGIKGRPGIIRQLKEACGQMIIKGEFATTVYYLSVQEEPTQEEGLKRLGIQVLRDQIVFNSTGDFDQNLEKYGLN